jgi:hypothetical protein
MTAPLLLNALQIAWMRLLQSEAITDENIKTAPLKVVAAVLQAASLGESDACALADAVIGNWDRDSDDARSVAIH